MPKVTVVAIFLATLASTAPSSAVAQEFTSTESIRAMFQQGYCAVRRNSATARRLFATPPGSKEEAKVIGALGLEHCLPVGLGLPYLEADRQLTRGVLAEAVLDDTRKRRVVVDPAVAPFGTLSAELIATLDARGRASVAGLDFAQCIVAASPEGVSKLLNTNPTRATQDKAIEQLRPYLGPCLPKGAEVTFSKLVLRGLLAEAQYRSLYFTTAAGKR